MSVMFTEGFEDFVKNGPRHRCELTQILDLQVWVSYSFEWRFIGAEVWVPSDQYWTSPEMATLDAYRYELKFGNLGSPIETRITTHHTSGG